MLVGRQSNLYGLSSIAYQPTGISPSAQLRICTLSYGDIYGQIMIWLIAVFLSLATGLALAVAEHPIGGFAVMCLILMLSLPFFLFTLVITLFNHLVLVEKSL